MSSPFETIRDHCLSKPGAYEDHPWGETVWKAKPKDKIFCFGGGPESATMTVKATLDEQSALIQLPGIKVAPYVGRHGWVSVDLSVPENLEFALELIDRSYELVIETKKSRPARAAP